MEMTSMDMSSELEFRLEMKNELETLRSMRNDGRTFHWSASHYSKYREDMIEKDIEWLENELGDYE